MYVCITKNILPDHAFTQRKTDLNTYIADTLIKNVCLGSFSTSASKITLNYNCSDSNWFLKKSYTQLCIPSHAIAADNIVGNFFLIDFMPFNNLISGIHFSSY